mmetsp:Transcript_49658/g.124848  ORF Transcript_49658/g.124848 Transcript_49658/m.124848 type:complete len:212 (-) Transcript_49658:131-766(-)|eukprot:CAMPEP_0174247118 /NCGR_PEP_ID=MMETSP0417-20130205/42412_1 /TAXON_ID=242541 /ORGANISM="Mayorella sp, Strain BSH-02190019" /LENGTH=211 /DNA_ID=CAMNT_0015326971 /DNA_START=572 /DNA_END=1207 /DNA_ORIENTATION=-
MSVSAALRKNFPAAERNREPILAVLRSYLSDTFSGSLLEVSSGSGQHCVHFGEAFRDATIQPTELDDLTSIRAWIDHSGLSNVRDPVLLDARLPSSEWPRPSAEPDSKWDAMLNVNMIHISPWSATEGLFAAAGALLKKDGYLFTYGPYKLDGEFTTESNRAFDRSLRERDPAWGLRDVDEVTELAREAGLVLRSRHDMPANNFLLAFQRH